jgi:hypothetical protein
MSNIVIQFNSFQFSRFLRKCRFNNTSANYTSKASTRTDIQHIYNTNRPTQNATQNERKQQTQQQHNINEVLGQKPDILKKTDQLIKDCQNLDFRLPPRCRWNLRSSGMLRGVTSQTSEDLRMSEIGTECSKEVTGFLKMSKFLNTNIIINYIKYYI